MTEMTYCRIYWRAMLLACFTVGSAQASCESNINDFLPSGGVSVGCGLGGTCYNPKAGGCGYIDSMPLEVISATANLGGTGWKYHGTVTSATCAKLTPVAKALLDPTKAGGVLVSHRHPTTLSAQDMLESFGCMHAETKSSACIRAVNPSESTDSDTWFNSGAPFDVPAGGKANNFCWQTLGSQCNGQRHNELTGVKESHFIAEAMQIIGVKFGNVSTSAWDRCYNGAKIISEVTGSATAIPKWELTQKVFWTSQPDAEELFDIFVKTVDGPVRISAMGLDYDLKLNERYGMLNTFVDHVQASKTTNMPAYINHHGWQAQRAHGVNQERGVSNIVLGTKDAYESAVYGKQRVYKMGQLHANAYQLAPSAWTAAAACHTIKRDYKEVASGSHLMELDANLDLKVTEDEFKAKCPSAIAIFKALDSEGATFAEDTHVCLSLGCTKSAAGSWGHDSDAGKNHICMVCDAQRKPAPVKNNGEISIGLMEEIRAYSSPKTYPWGFRKIVAVTQELPKSAIALHALYKPESMLIHLGCDGTPQPALVAKLTDHSLINKATFEALFAGLERYKTKALFAAYSTKECPAEWRGKYIQGDETQLAQGLSYNIGQSDSVFNFNGAGVKNISDHWPAPALELPTIVGRYFNGKVRLAAELWAQDKLTFDEVTRIFCAYKAPLCGASSRRSRSLLFGATPGGSVQSSEFIADNSDTSLCECA